jgi:FAD/FMN-containing dehydrogenase
MGDQLIEQLREIVGPAGLVTRPAECEPYLEDWRGRYRGRARSIVRPATTGEVARVVALCAASRVPIVPQGGNTGLCGGATPLADGRAVLVNLSRLNRIRSVDAENNALVAEAGCTLAAVQEAAAAADRMFPLSLASEGSCQIGGNLSTNAGGVHVLRYGNCRELALGLEVVLPDGAVWQGLRALRKDNTGYDLKQFFIGAEGTLGIITAAALKLFPRPRERATAWAAVASPAVAVTMLGRLRDACGDRVEAAELVGAEALQLVLQHIPGSRDPLPAHHGWAVLIELADVAAGSALHCALQDFLCGEIERGGVVDAVVAESIAQARALWSLRENISEAQKLEGFSIKHDISVPVSALPAFLDEAGRALAVAVPGVRVVAFGHIGDGNLHYNLSMQDSSANDDLITRTAEVNHLVHDIVDRLQGSISAEHGLGQLKRQEVLRYKSAVEIALMQRIKQALDPHGLMNPGKLL